MKKGRDPAPGEQSLTPYLRQWGCHPASFLTAAAWEVHHLHYNTVNCNPEGAHRRQGNGERSTKGTGVLGKAPRDGAALRDLKDQRASAGEAGGGHRSQRVYRAPGAKALQSLTQNLKGEQVEKVNGQEPCVLPKVFIHTCWTRLQYWKT